MREADNDVVGSQFLPAIERQLFGIGDDRDVGRRFARDEVVLLLKIEIVPEYVDERGCRPDLSFEQATMLC